MGKIFAGMIIGVIGVGYTKLVYMFGKNRGENKSDSEWMRALNTAANTILNKEETK